MTVRDIKTWERGPQSNDDPSIDLEMRSHFHFWFLWGGAQVGGDVMNSINVAAEIEMHGVFNWIMCVNKCTLIYLHIVHVLVNCAAVDVLISVIAYGLSTRFDNIVKMIFFTDFVQRFGYVARLIVKVGVLLIISDIRSSTARRRWSTTFASGRSLFPGLWRTTGFRTDHHFLSLSLSLFSRLMPIIWITENVLTKIKEHRVVLVDYILAFTKSTRTESTTVNPRVEWSALPDHFPDEWPAEITTVFFYFFIIFLFLFVIFINHIIIFLLFLSFFFVCVLWKRRTTAVEFRYICIAAASPSGSRDISCSPIFSIISPVRNEMEKY